MIRLEAQNSAGEVVQRLVLSADNLARWDTFFEQLHPVWLRSRVRQFETAGAELGTPWAMYSRATGEHRYAAAKASIFGRRLTQQDLLRWLTGDGQERLYPSITDPNHPEHVAVIGRDSASFGTRVPYAGNHNDGIGRGPEWAGDYPIPARPFMGFGDLQSSFNVEMAELLQSWIASGLSEYQGRAGLRTV